jgi:phosphatidylglycerophosphatase A
VLEKGAPPKIPTNGSASKEHVHWFKKARSRAWAKSDLDLSPVPLWALVAGTFFAAGLFPIASGTFASLLAALLVHFIEPLQTVIPLVVASLVYLGIGIAASNVIERKLSLDDPSMIVADEVVGQWIALIPWTVYGGWKHALIGFIAFRFFDIVKVWPASVLERQHGGFGVMMDDVVAGIYANIATNLILIYLFS